MEVEDAHLYVMADVVCRCPAWSVPKFIWGSLSKWDRRISSTTVQKTPKDE